MRPSNAGNQPRRVLRPGRQQMPGAEQRPEEDQRIEADDTRDDEPAEPGAVLEPLQP